VDDDVGLVVGKEAVVVGEDAEVIFGQVGNIDVLALTVFTETMNKTRAKEAFPARNDDSFGAEIDHPRVQERFLAARAFRPSPGHGRPASVRSASTMIRTKSRKEIRGFQPRAREALEASARRKSTSVGRKYWGSISTRSRQSRPA